MRAALFGLVGIVLAAGGAEAAECRAGHMTLQSDTGGVFRVEKASVVRGRSDGLATERAVFRGVYARKRYNIDIQGMQGGSTTTSSYSGAVEPWLSSPVWRTRIPRIKSGAIFEVQDGPLKGEWKASCG